MAGTTVTGTPATPMGSLERYAAAQVNLLIDDVELLRATLSALITDVTAIRAAVVAITAKLDLDGGVTDVNYASTCDPAALTVVAANVNAAGDLVAANINDASGEIR